MFLFISAAVSAQVDTSLCLSFHRGNFTYTNDSGHTVYLKRNGRMQQENIRETGIVTRLKLRWISACSYEIKQVWSNSKALRRNNGASTVVHITSAAKYSYEFACNCKGVEALHKKGIVYKVNTGL